MTEGEEGKGNVAKARRSSPSVDRMVRGENDRSLASQQRPASIEFTGIGISPQPILRSNEPAFHPMGDRDGSAQADSRYSRPQRSDSIRQAAGATNGTDDRAVANKFTNKKAADPPLLSIGLLRIPAVSACSSRSCNVFSNL
jgi:hypothetical protein